VPVDVAIRRVVKRRVALASGTDDGVDSEDDFGSDDEERPALMEAAEGKSAEPQLNYYEAGLDLKLSEDPVENFHQFQTLVKAEYDALASEFNFNVIPAEKGIAEQHEMVWKAVGPTVEPLQYSVPLLSQSANIFDK
ncbi:tmk, partial [Symbiodinium sp. KB8]